MSPETEERFSRQLTTFEELVKHLATKEDLANRQVTLILWLIGTNIAIGAGVLWYVNQQFAQLYLFLQHWKPA